MLSKLIGSIAVALVAFGLSLLLIPAVGILFGLFKKALS